MSITRKLMTRTAIWLTAPGAVVGIAAAPARAPEPRHGRPPATCDVESNGHIVQVPEGTRYGLFYCGDDGNWHFGLLNLNWKAVAAPTPTSPKPGTGVLATGGTTLAR